MDWELLQKWRYEKDPSAQAQLLEQLFEDGIFPKRDTAPTWDEYEMYSGTNAALYPDVKSDTFVEDLMRKQEFHESKQQPIREQYLSKKDKCRSTEDFELSPVQRFIGRLLSPNTPYTSALLYHGVGVGKTCAAITVCEAYLELNPGKKVIIIAPPNIQVGFRRTIFDIEALRIGAGDIPNNHIGCTQNTYLNLTNSLKERNKTVIESRIEKAIKSRYEFHGYTSFYNLINNLTKTIPKTSAGYEQRKREILRREFSNRAIIVDEAHNLRDVFSETEEDTKDFVTDADANESSAGKRLTPFLRDVLKMSEGITLVLMTATPMYNSYTEIIFLLNLLLINDKFPTISVQDVFDTKAGDGTFTGAGRLLLGKLVNTYISFMRGENPLTFPLRLKPTPDMLLESWPESSPKDEEIDEDERDNAVSVLPCQPCVFSPGSESIYREEANSIESLGITNTDRLIQAGNWLFPGDEDTEFSYRIGDRGFDRSFTSVKQGAIIGFTPSSSAEWLIGANLKQASPKCHTLIQRLALCRGVAFVYSRFIKAGALPIALALEANGYTPWSPAGSTYSYLNGVPKSPEGRQCALCSRREVGHGMVQEENGTPAHGFKPAKFVLISGSEDYSPNNAAAINAARLTTNIYGADVKVILGTQVAGEGLDLRYIREVIVFDSWYHLNRLEQVVGRGIRNCSHSLLEQTKRNCTIVLLVSVYENNDKETIDLYSYRQALKKAVIIGKVTRVIKEFAIDCFLNINVNLVKDMPKIPFILDSQGEKRDGDDHTGISIDDKGFTPMCDWMEDCEYTCKKGDGSELRKDAFNLDEQDISTYDEYAARYHMLTIRKYLQTRISKAQVYITFDQLKNEFVTIPPAILSSILNDIVSQRDIKIVTTTADGKELVGHIIRRGNYYLFQPDTLKDESIPIALRLAHVPIPRDIFTPLAMKAKEDVKEEVQEEGSFINSSAETLWKEVLLLAQNMEHGKTVKITDELIHAVNSLPQSKGISKAQKERVEMMIWMYISIRDSVSTRKMYAQIIREYIWDEFIPTATQIDLIKKYELNTELEEHKNYVKKVIAYSYWLFESVKYIRLVNTETNAIEVLQVDVAKKEIVPSPLGVQEVLKREKGRDPLTSAGINTRTTGYNYGFIIFNEKVQKLVFKKGKPSESGALSRGSECAKNSTTRFEIAEIIKYGSTLQDAKLNSLGLTNEELKKEGRSVTNSIRVCTLVDLSLRMMNAMNVNNKRWFYRPLEATLYGHPLR
jgi:hypothetical protein